MTAEATTFEFKTETKKLLDLMIHSVYSHKEIFLRELISNASDALDKLRFEALTQDGLRAFTQDAHIRLEVDDDKHSLTVSDNGIGMSRDEIISFIGTIAKSGTKDFLNMLPKEQEKTSAPEFIGQFGVGFYSSFMVAERVTLISRRAGETQAWKWESTGDGTYTMSETDRETPGTTVTLTLKPLDKDDDDAQDFTQEWTLREIVRKYSDFVAYPIKMKVQRTRLERDADGKAKEGAKEETVVEDETLNSMKAIWARPEKEVTEDEYKEFYKHISHDWNEPLERIVYKAEGATSEFRALLFLPEKPAPDLLMGNTQRGINLYIRRVFIMNDCKDLIPEYLRFVRGVIDSEDLSLNISREILQQNKQIQTIRKSATKKILDTIKAMRTKDKAKFDGFWSNFGPIVKEGLFKEPDDRDRLFEVCLFASTQSPTELTTIDEYVSRMKPGQEHIYYLSGETRQAIEQSPHLEAFRDKGYEVLLLSDPVDEVWVQFSGNIKGKRLQSAAKGSAELGSEEERKKAEETRKEKETTYQDLLTFFKKTLENEVKDVRLSSRLTKSPVCLVGETNDMTPHLEHLLKAAGKDVPKVKRILELNPQHPLLEKMQTLFNSDQKDPRLADYARLLHDQALLAEGGKIDNPAFFSEKMSEFMVRALAG